MPGSTCHPNRRPLKLEIQSVTNRSSSQEAHCPADSLQVVIADCPELRTNAGVLGGMGPELTGGRSGLLPGFALGRKWQARSKLHRCKLDTTLWCVEHEQHVIHRSQIESCSRGRRPRP